MYNLLIVDDEKFAVEGVRKSCDWEQFGIRQVKTAFHADEARTIMIENRIDILICDIDMPDEDGLSLVRWVKANSPNTESLFLTCHSEFAFAKQAIQLGSFDYLLKPVDGEELSLVVTRVVHVLKEKEKSLHQSDRYHKICSLWDKHSPLVVERFWRDLLSRRILSFGDDLQRALQDAGLPLTQNHTVLPILVSVEEWSGCNLEMTERTVRKTAEELFFDQHSGHMVSDDDGGIFAMAYASDSDPCSSSSERWSNASSRFIEVCEEHFQFRVSCYVGHFASFQELAYQCDNLKAMERSNITQIQSVFHYRQPVVQYSPTGTTFQMNVSEWLSYLLNGNREKLIDLVHLAFGKLEATKDVQSRDIEIYYYDILQVIYHFLYLKGIGVLQVPNFSLWTSARIHNLAKLKNWTINLISAVMDAAFNSQELNGFVQKSIKYIKDNVEENISREDVAAYVGLNPDYLSRVFKKETGTNLIDYLIETKMIRAKQLLDSTKMSVSAVAQQLGYSNFSHFSKMFKKQNGVNPQEYRKESALRQNGLATK